MRDFTLILALALALGGVAVAAATAGQTVDEQVCPFPLGVTVGAKSIELRNLSTGRVASLSRSPRRIWLAPVNEVPYLSTDRRNGDPRVIDPCALVAATPPSTRPLETRAPWPAPAFTLSRIAEAGLVPVTAGLVRHDHVHLDLIVNGRR